MIDLTPYSHISVSISGGKDSQVLLGVMVDAVHAQAWPGELFAVHADTGAEWPQSRPHCKMLCNHYGIKLHVGKAFRALPDHIERRCGIVAQWNVDHAAECPDLAARYLAIEKEYGFTMKHKKSLAEILNHNGG